MNMAHVANRIWYGANLVSWKCFCSAIKSPMSAQTRLLQGYMKRNADTAFGKRYGFSAIRSIQDFQKTVPLTSYDDYEPFIDPIGKGVPNQLTADRVTRLMPTSGSSGAAKYIPYTNRLQAEFNRAIGPWIVDLFSRHPSAMGGPAYWAVSPAIDLKGKPGWTVPVGFEDDTKYLGACLSRLVSRVLAVPTDVRHIQDIRNFKFITLAFLLAHRNLRFVSIWHPSYLNVLLAELSTSVETIIKCLHDGVLHLPGDRRGSVHTRFRSAWKKNILRARELTSIDICQGRQLWPNLAVISSWGHGASQLPWNESVRTFPSTVHQPKGLIATEAVMTIPIRDHFPLTVNSHFFEFIDDTGRVLTCDQLKQDREYEIVLTTGGGLYRYRIGDRVRVNGFVESTPSLIFIGRGACISDLCGEKLSEAFVSRCLESILVPYAGSVTSAVLHAERRNGTLGYCLRVKVLNQTSEICETLKNELEMSLQENPHYALCVRLKQLKPARVITDLLTSNEDVLASQWKPLAIAKRGHEIE
jgi:hypothetical protein